MLTLPRCSTMNVDKYCEWCKSLDISIPKLSDLPPYSSNVLQNTVYKTKLLWEYNGSIVNLIAKLCWKYEKSKRFIMHYNIHVNRAPLHVYDRIFFYFNIILIRTIHSSPKYSMHNFASHILDLLTKLIY